MPLADLEVTLTEQELEIRNTARRFAQDMLRSAGTTLDRLPDPADVVESHSVLWRVFDKYRELDL
ncbi:MAG: hypothetical protein ACRDL7_07635, partial [Gaiellaceae bacterium]